MAEYIRILYLHELHGKKSELLNSEKIESLFFFLITIIIFNSIQKYLTIQVRVIIFLRVSLKYDVNVYFLL